MIKSSIFGWFPASTRFFNASFGGQNTDTNQSWQRQGTSSAARTYRLPSETSQSVMASGYYSHPEYVQPAHQDFLTNLLQRNKSDYPGTQQISDIINLDPSSFNGDEALFNIMSRNPYSSDYESNTGELYDRSFEKARAEALSGPANVRGPVGRQGIELAELGNLQSINRFKEVRGQQDKEASNVTGAIQLFNTIESMRRGSSMQAQQQARQSEGQTTQEQLGGAQAADRMKSTHLAMLQMVAELLGVPTATTTDNLSGTGNTNSSATSWSTSTPQCCFIFLECLNGQLPWYVRWGRECYRTENRISGYRWMSHWLVPAMQKFSPLKRVMNAICIRPFLKWGYAQYVSRETSIWKSWCWGWFHIWSFIGWLRNGKA